MHVIGRIGRFTFFLSYSGTLRIVFGLVINNHCRPYSARTSYKFRVISRNLKLGGIDKCLGGVYMRKAQIYIEIL